MNQAISGLYSLIFQDGIFQKKESTIPVGLEINTSSGDISVKLKKDKKIERGIMLLMGVSGDSEMKTLVEVGKNAELCVFKKYFYRDSGNILDKNDIVLEDNGKLEYVQSWQEGSNISSYLTASVYRDACFHSFTHTRKGKSTRHEILVKLLKTGASAEVHGLYDLSGNERADHYSNVDHLAAHTNSHQLFKGILRDDAYGVYTGNVSIFPGIDGVDASQLNKNLLLGKKSHSFSRPELNISADDVRCTHGVATGQLMEDELFYLQIRGVREKQARQILVQAFANDAFEKILSPVIRCDLENTLGVKEL